MSADVSVGPVRVGRRDGEWFAEADVAGVPVWFRSRDAELDRSAEAMASAVLLPAVRRRHRVRVVEDVVSATWLSNTASMMGVWNRWWKYPVIVPEATTGPAEAPQAMGTTLCFTGGVDSFHSLLRGRHRADVITFVHGYDIRLDDERRMAAWRADFDAIATAVRETNRIIVAHEDQLTSGFGAELCAVLQERLLWSLEAPIARVAGWDTPYPHAQEWAYFPGPARLGASMIATMKA